MIWKLALLFTIIPTLELALLIWIGTQIGVLWTTVIVIVTGFVGAWLAKREGVGVLRRLRDDLSRGMPPASRITEGVLVLVGGLLLVTPGVLTDLTGFLLILPLSRRLIAPVVLQIVMRQVTGNPDFKVDLGVQRSESGKPAAPPRPSPPGGDPHFDHPVR